MTKKKLGLNRGLDALLTTTNYSSGTFTQVSPNHSEQMISQMSPEQLIPGQFQPRSTITIEELSELVESIKTQGVLQPIIVRPTLTAGRYEIIAGERRWRAAIEAQLSSVPIIIKPVSDQQALIIAIIENIQRENLNPLEEAIALDRLAKEFSLTHHEIANAVGKSRTSISNLLRILQLPDEIKKLLDKKVIDLGHAKVLAGASYDVQILLAHKITTEQLSVRATEKLLQQYQSPCATANNNHDLDYQTNLNQPKKKSLLQDPNILTLQQQISAKLGAKTTIIAKHNKNKGKLVITYNNLEEFAGILERLQINLDEPQTLHVS